MSETDNRPNASATGTFDVGGDLAVNRLGFGAMRMCGPGVWGSLRTWRSLWACCDVHPSWASTSSIPPTPTARR
jgi:hypothetical protein